LPIIRFSLPEKDKADLAGGDVGGVRSRGRLSRPAKSVPAGSATAPAKRSFEAPIGSEEWRLRFWPATRPFQSTFAARYVSRSVGTRQGRRGGATRGATYRSPIGLAALQRKRRSLFDDVLELPTPVFGHELRDQPRHRRQIHDSSAQCALQANRLGQVVGKLLDRPGHGRSEVPDVRRRLPQDVADA
jgi:hypothetical protein